MGAATKYVASAKEIFNSLRLQLKQAAPAQEAALLAQTRAAGISGEEAKLEAKADGSGNGDGAAAGGWVSRLRASGVDESKLGELAGFCDKALQEAPERLRVTLAFVRQQAEERSRREAHQRALVEAREASTAQALEQEGKARQAAAERARLKQLELATLTSQLAMEHASQETRR